MKRQKIFVVERNEGGFLTNESEGKRMDAWNTRVPEYWMNKLRGNRRTSRLKEYEVASTTILNEILCSGFSRTVLKKYQPVDCEFCGKCILGRLLTLQYRKKSYANRIIGNFS